ncbi:DUF86 domain-containing protein [Roseofilum reptotaenium CS-1145]|uniref:Uncharacterized protein n=1 Tax=Roseofilum reptotaenium AO1-A TaxID=1925591 RepID=A0A1L9QPW9_9CYAN|nr:HepT-like ribonuclease domain-containing protein [Roseofilum reptotaenium]MDB9516648.1 DUF86 domain-containing protein [Roseofilum reptotaenium CS-1145]OJJ24689.1 hypothetical protein BI308_15435 [Roseofilum reptotaenium AO1-A]
MSGDRDLIYLTHILEYIEAVETYTAQGQNVLVHDYLGGINLQRVWDAIENNLPALKGQVELMLKDFEEED